MPYSIGEIARALGGTALGQRDLVVTHAGEPGHAGADGLAVALDASYAEALAADTSRAALVWEGADWQALGLDAAITVDRGRAALVPLTRLLDPGPDEWDGLHPSAVIHPEAKLAADVTVGPFSVIGRGARIGEGSRIGAQCGIGAGVVLGAGARLFPGAHLLPRIHIGRGFIAHTGAVIGADGFSFVTPDTLNLEEARKSLGKTNHLAETTAGDTTTWQRIHSLGTVEIGDNVEVGVNSSIDRGTLRATKIGHGTKVDNLVQIGHNVIVGDNCLICAMSGLAGSVRMGNRVVVGAKGGISDNLVIGDDVVIAGGSGVLSNVPTGQMVMGYPATKMETNLNMYKALRRLPRLLGDFKALQNAVSKGTKDT
ncbi:MAG: UDP-3-O-(3-hydroxymyristoyl)glucosamine N-acyltransferase [Pseudomonadota bacterium]